MVRIEMISGAAANKIRRIGLTGGIGAGKSEVTNWLRSNGYTVIDADETAREAAAPGEPVVERLRGELGGSVFLPDGNLDRKALARLMFSDPEILAKVNAIFHGEIRERMERKAAAYAEGAANSADAPRPLFLSAPLLFETGGDWDTDEIWLVSADEDVRIKRVLARDGASEADAKARMNSQMSEAEKRSRADVIIENNGTLAELCAKLKNMVV